jgi:hypothetical protein
MNEQGMDWVFIQERMHPRTQKAPYETDFIGHINNLERFPFLDLPSKGLS